MSDNKCFSKDCYVIGGAATDAELFASVAIGGAIAGRFGRERQINNLAALAREMAETRRERINVLGFSLSISLIPIFTSALATLIFKLQWWVSIIIFIVLIALMLFIVLKLNVLKVTIIKITFSKCFTKKIIKKHGAFVYKLTINDINTTIKEQFEKIIKEHYPERYWTKYKYTDITQDYLQKKNINLLNE